MVRSDDIHNIFHSQVVIALQKLILRSNSEKKNSFNVLLELLMEWYHPTIKFNHIKWDKRRNILEQGKVWSPEIKFNNHVHSEGGEPIQSGLFVVRRTNGDQNSKEELVMREIFSGAENPFQKIEVYELDLNCALTNLSRYPFDTEICSIEMFPPGDDYDLVPKADFRFEPKHQSMGDLLLSNYWLKSSKNAKNISHISVQLSFVRNLRSIIFLKYFPVFLMNLINHMSNYLRSTENINGIVGLNICSIVAIILLFISSSNDLPVTIKMKSFDQWVLACLSYPCLVIVLNIILYQARLKELQNLNTGDDKKAMDEEERVNLCNGTSNISNNPTGITISAEEPPDPTTEEGNSAKLESKDMPFTDILECILLYLLPTVYVFSNMVYLSNGFLM